MYILINLLSFLAVFIAMEFVAWALHKYVMHGFLWFLPKGHHQKSKGFFELNDLFFFFFAAIGSSFIVIGLNQGWLPLFYIGIGVTAYGVAYAVVHDVLIHRRIKIISKPKSAYLRKLILAHHKHHSTLNKKGTSCFGMLWVNSKQLSE